MTEFGKLHPAGRYEHVVTIKQSDMMKCPFSIMVPEHYRADSSCLCDDYAHRQKMICDWDYSEEDFKDIPRCLRSGIHGRSSDDCWHEIADAWIEQITTD